ncbi:MAG TPA: tetratricopeptide repeat protein [Nevskiaceae bacterium]
MWLLLPLGIALGWAFGRRAPEAPSPTPRDHVANDAADDGPTVDAAGPAIDFGSAARAAGVSAFDIRKLLGAAFRERGDVEQAIAIHTQMIASAAAGPMGVSASVVDGAKLELARDYVAAGLLDRAQRTLAQLMHHGTVLEAALELARDVHEQSKDWSAALAVVERLQAIQARNLHPLMGHYRCELATAAETAGDTTEAVRQAQRALEVDPRSVRASLLVGDLAERRADWNTAIHAWSRVPRQDPRFVSEVLPRLERVCRRAGKWKEFIEFMAETDRDHPDSVSVALVQARLLDTRGQDASAYLARSVARSGRLAGFLAWLEIRSTRHPEDTQLAELRGALRRRVENEPRYRCAACGLASKLLIWQCPGCKHWGSVVPDGEHA